MNTTALPDLSRQDQKHEPGRPVASLRRRRLDLPLTLSVAFVALFVVLAVDGPLLVGEPTAQNLMRRLTPPGVGGHLLGTDQLGRDVLSRLVTGSRVSVLVGITAALLSGLIGSAIGIVSGYVGGWTDRLLIDRKSTRLNSSHV